MHRNELNLTNEQITHFVQEQYRMKICQMHFIDSGSFFGFILENKGALKFFLKIYPKDRINNQDTVSKESLEMIGRATTSFRTQFGLSQIARCIANKDGEYCYEDKDFYMALYSYIEGSHPSYSPNQLSSDKLAKIFFQLHQIPFQELTNFPMENFDITNALAIKPYLSQAISHPMLAFMDSKKSNLLKALDKLQHWQESFLQQSFDMVITHGDAHHYNVLQTPLDLWLVDWDDIKIAPRERDLWHYENAPLIKEYATLDPTFQLNHPLCRFYQLQRFLEDIHYYLEQVLLYKNTTKEQDEKDKQSFINHWGWQICLK